MARRRPGPLVDEPIGGDGGPDILVLEDDDGVVLDEGDEPRPAAYGFPRGMRPWREAALLVAVVAVGTVLALRLWNAHLGVPFVYRGDGMFTGMITKTVRDHGWTLTNPRIGAPFHGQLFDYPTGGENLHWLVIKLLGLVTPSWIAMDNLYFLATFFLVGLAAYFVARYLRFDVIPSLVVATLYTFVPYHLAHGEAQLPRAGYYTVPFGALLVLWVIDYRTRFFDTESGVRLSLAIRRRRWAFALGVCLVLGASDTQNTAFLGGLVVLVGLLAAFARRDLRPVAIAALLGAVMLGSLAVNNAPSVLYRLQHGPNTVATDRNLSDQDTYALSLSRMLLPSRGYLFAPLAHLEQKARTGSLVQGEDGDALGLVAAVGLVAGFLYVLSDALRRRTGERPRRTGFIERLGAINLIAFLVATAGGLSFLLAVMGFKLLRTWNRMVVVIAFFALLTAGLLLHALLTRWRARGATTGAIALAVAALLLFGIFDQNPGALVPTYAAFTHKYQIDHGFFTGLEARLPRGAMVFQYPIVPFPEAGPTYGMADYEHFAGVLNTKALRWSYGAMKGRPESDWQTVLAQLPVDAQFAAIAAAGFDAVEINRTGFGDHARALEAALAARVGAPLQGSADGRLVAYDLAAERQRVTRTMSADDRRAFEDAVLHPVAVSFPDGFYADEGTLASPQRWAQQRSTIVLDNLSSHRVRAELSATLTGHRGTLDIQGAGLHERVTVRETGTAWRTSVSLPPGRSTVHLVAHVAETAANNDARELYVNLSGITAWPDALTQGVCTFTTAAARPPGACATHR